MEIKTNENYINIISALKDYIERNISSNHKENPYFLFYKYKNIINSGNYKDITNNNLSNLGKILDILNSPSNNNSKIPFDYENTNINKNYPKESIEYKIITILKINKDLFKLFSLNLDQLSELINIILKNNEVDLNTNTIKDLLIRNNKMKEENIVIDNNFKIRLCNIIKNFLFSLFKIIIDKNKNVENKIELLYTYLYQKDFNKINKVILTIINKNNIRNNTEFYHFFIKLINFNLKIVNEYIPLLYNAHFTKNSIKINKNLIYNLKMEIIPFVKEIQKINCN